ncbi:LysR family transcriptional regulator [Pararhizobium sp. YC-54]|nr:LysR family transcriptional regulator [Pararhizobium sp. YC-54]
MRVAVEVARRGSFTAASRHLRLSGPSVSRVIAELEVDLGIRLFNRTTRQLHLTDAGQEFVQKSTGLLEELEQMRISLRERSENPHGHLRISCVTAFGNECLAPVLPEFLRRFPQLSVSVDIGNRIVDLVGEHYDLAIRVGPLNDSTLVAQKIATQNIIFVASPQFCEVHGMPRTIDDLAGMPSVMQVSGEWGRQHRFEQGREPIDFEVPQQFTMSSSRAVRNACLTGYGYALLAEFMVAGDIAAGRLLRLLPDYQPVEQPIYAFHAQRRHTPRKVRVLIDYLHEAFAA